MRHEIVNMRNDIGHGYDSYYHDNWLQSDQEINNITTRINFIGIPTIIGYLTPYIMNTVKEFAREKLTTYEENLLWIQLTRFTEKHLSWYLAIGFV